MIPRPAPLPDFLIEPVVRLALAEDLASAGDVTTAACLLRDRHQSVRLTARTEGVLAGLDCVRIAFRALDAEVRFEPHRSDGDTLEPGAAVATVSGSARAILAAERTALNLVCHLSGVATLTRAYVDAVADLPVRIADTRKTLPGLRGLQKYAVACGGGLNHRHSLADAILIKDNHIAACGGAAAALQTALERRGHLTSVEIEVDDLDQLGEVIGLGPDVVLLDNFTIPDLKKAVDLVAGRARIEASGGVNLQTVRAVAETGVDVISVGALTHSAPVLDLGLDAA
ncbi:carboxylating nicotinate-nucleotide diphosphorylase [Brevundimonas sp. 2R-24]|uniref:nicotinate-nucleotide diphosphorylase (carboxylating) n=1 Tax=Peiella sedimenti TaxID=3061083 RepID=A0ABT8SPD2_9CAUL|nr:carboxylating nicotinate-nucleotide diphosphorylase [Caulobacteraceae bacterium XZ-24]